MKRGREGRLWVERKLLLSTPFYPLCSKAFSVLGRQGRETLQKVLRMGDQIEGAVLGGSRGLLAGV